MKYLFSIFTLCSSQKSTVFCFLSIFYLFTCPLHSRSIFNPFHATDLFWYPLKTSENERISDVFRRYQKRSVAWNELIILQRIFLMKYSTLTLSWRRPLSYRNQSIAEQMQRSGLYMMDWFLYDNGLRHERVKYLLFGCIWKTFNGPQWSLTEFTVLLSTDV